VANRPERAPGRVARRRLARVHARLGSADQRAESLGVHEPGALAEQLRVLAAHEPRVLELGLLKSQQLGALAGGALRSELVVERLARVREIGPAGPHLLDVGSEAGGGVEQLAMALHPAQRLMLVLPIGP